MTVHEGHRSRVRERYRQEGLEGFAPHEVLELLLFYGRSRGDTNAEAHALLDHFGSLRAVLEAPPDQLMQIKGIGEESAVLISMIVPLFRRYMALLAEKQRSIASREEAEEFCKALLAGWRSERFYALALNSSGRLLGCRLIAEGSLSEVPAYPRAVAEAALQLNAASLILCHNHPGGSTAPSGADLETTDQLETMLSMLGIPLLDHIIIAGNEAWSMAQHGQICSKHCKRSKHA